jgi:hypothetical protein
MFHTASLQFALTAEISTVPDRALKEEVKRRPTMEKLRRK